MSEDETVHPFTEQQREDSLGKANEPERSTESCISEYKETMTKGKEVEKIFHKMQARTEIKSTDSCYSMAHVLEKASKIFLESIEDLEDSDSNPNTDNCGRLSEPLDRDVTNIMVSKIKTSINNTLHEVVASTSDALNKDSRLQDDINEKNGNNYSSTEMDSVLSQMTVNDKAIQYDSLDECTYICNAKQTSPSHNTSIMNSNILLCKQISTSLGEVQSDNSITNKCSEQVNNFSTSENIPPLHASFCNSSGVNTHITNEESINTSPLVRNLNSYEKIPCKDRNDITSTCPNKNNSRLREMSTRTPEISSLNTENVNESQSIDLKDIHITREKQRDSHTSKTTGEEFVVVAELENIPLKEREDPLRARGEMSAKGNTEELCSLPIKTNEDCENISVRPCFQLATMDKKAKKMQVQLNLPRVCQGEMQTLCASTSEMASISKEKLLLQKINDSQNSRESGQTMNIYTAVEEGTLGKKLFNHLKLLQSIE